MTAPRYQDIPANAIPEVTDDDGVRVRVICGEFWGKKGPVEGVAADPSYLDIFVPPGNRKRLAIETTRNAFAYVFAGAGTFRDASEPRAVLTDQVAKPDAAPVYDAANHSLVLFDRGDEVTVQAGPEGIRFLLVSGKPIEEPVAWYGPIVMNTREQLRTGDGRTARRHVYQAPLIARRRGLTGTGARSGTSACAIVGFLQGAQDPLSLGRLVLRQSRQISAGPWRPTPISGIRRAARPRFAELSARRGS